MPQELAPHAAVDAQRSAEGRNEWRAGWAPLLGATIATASGSSIFVSSAGLFVKPIQQAEGWSRGQIAGAMSAAVILMAFSMPVAGYLVDRFGHRRVGGLALTTYGLLCCALSFAPPSLTTYYVLIFCIAIFGPSTGSICFLPGVAARFQRRRALAFGIATSGTSILLLPLSPLLADVMDAFGWRAGYLILALLPLLAGLPAALWLTGSRAPRDAKARNLAKNGGEPPHGLFEAMKTATYWKMVLATFAAVIPIGGFMSQLFALLSGKGISAHEIGLMAAVFAGAAIVGRLTICLMLDTLWPPLVASVAMLGPLTATALLLWAPPSFALCMLSTALLGYSQGAVGDLEAFFTVRQFGVTSFAKIFATFAMCNAFAFSGGAVLFGLIFDFYKSYDIALVFALFSFTVSGLAFLSLGFGGSRRIAPAMDVEIPNHL